MWAGVYSAVGRDVRPTTRQLTALLGDDGWVVEKMRWGLVPFWRSGKPLKDTEKGKGDGFKLTTFNGRCENEIQLVRVAIDDRSEPISTMSALPFARNTCRPARMHMASSAR